MENFEKVCINRHLRNTGIVAISFVGTVSIIGLALTIYSIVLAKYLFALWYFVAFVLGLVYTVIKINATFPTYVMTDGEVLSMSIWENGIMPYQLPEKPNFFSDFIPEKIRTDEILIKEIDSIYIGSNKFLEKSLEEDKIPEILHRLSKDKHLKATIKRMDFMLVVAKDGEECFMSVTGFDISELANLLNTIERNGTGVQIFTNIPKLIKLRDAKKA